MTTCQKVGMIMKSLKKFLLILAVLILAFVYAYGIWPRAIYDTDIGSNAYEVSMPLAKDMVLEQSFQCKDEGFCGIRLKLTKQMNQQIGTYQWTVTEQSSGEKVGEGIINDASTANKDFNSQNLQKQGFIELQFPRQKDSAGRVYTFVIQAQDVPEDESMAIYVTDKGEVESTLILAGEELKKAGVIRLQYRRFNTETFLVFLGIMAYLAVFIRFMYRLFR